MNLKRNNMKNKIFKFLEYWKKENEENDFYQPKLFGESKSVEYKIDGLSKSFCKVTEWSNGEGFDVSFDTEKQPTKTISLHIDEVDVFLACLNHLKYFTT